MKPLNPILNWQPMPGYENYYEINALGPICSLAKRSRLKDKRHIRYLKTKVNNCGYLQVHLSQEGNTRTYSLHRLLALAFIPNPENKKEVNHLDGSKLNNQLHNLEWATR